MNDEREEGEGGRRRDEREERWLIIPMVSVPFPRPCGRGKGADTIGTINVKKAAKTTLQRRRGGGGRFMTIWSRHSCLLFIGLPRN